MSGSDFSGLPEYADGSYYDLDPGRHGDDAAFKAAAFLRLAAPVMATRGWKIGSYADVGCGSGLAVHAVLEGLRQAGQDVGEAWGFDVHAGVEGVGSAKGVRFRRGDFAAADVQADLVTLFDVVEHVPDPVGFLKAVAARSDYVGLHLPLDNSIHQALRNRWRAKLTSPGHLVFLDPAQALALVTLAGLRIVDYAYTPVFRAPSGGDSRLARLARLPRAMLYAVSPWLLARTFGGCSLMILAETRTGWARARG